MKNGIKWTAAIIGLICCIVLAFGGFGALIDGEALSKIDSDEKAMTGLFCLLLGIAMAQGAFQIVGWMIDKTMQRYA